MLGTATVNNHPSVYNTRKMEKEVNLFAPKTIPKLMETFDNHKHLDVTKLRNSQGETVLHYAALN